jgi:hypothetical protein
MGTFFGYKMLELQRLQNKAMLNLFGYDYLESIFFILDDLNGVVVSNADC